MGSPVYCVLTVLEIVRYHQRGWRFTVAAVVTALAMVIGWSTMVLYAHGKFQ
jgi:hypothetical protein